MHRAGVVGFDAPMDGARDVFVLEIKDWSSTFDNHRTRAIKGPLKWVSFPSRQDGEGFLALMRKPNALEAYAVFCLLVQLAAKCPTRGVLADEKGDITPRRFAVRFGFPMKTCDDAFSVLTSEEVGWLVEVRKSGDARRDPAASGDTCAIHGKPTEPTPQGIHNRKDSASPVGSVGWGSLNPSTIARLTEAGATPEEFQTVLAQCRQSTDVRNPVKAAAGTLMKKYGLEKMGNGTLRGPLSDLKRRVERLRMTRAP